MEKKPGAGLTADDRKKAIQLSCGLLIAGFIFMLRSRQVFLVFFCLSAAAFASGMLFPRLISPVLAGLDWSITRLTRLFAAVVLTIFYFFILTPFALAQRLFTGREKAKDSYWQPKPAEGPGIAGFQRQF
jgi:hypothetical protein